MKTIPFEKAKYYALKKKKWNLYIFVSERIDITSVSWKNWLIAWIILD